MRHNHEHVISASGIIADANIAGLLDVPDIHVARTLARLYGETDELVILATALSVHSLRAGSVCLNLAEAPTSMVAVETEEASPAVFSWPQNEEWCTALRRSPMVGIGENAPPNARPLRLVDDLVYLERYWLREEVVRRILLDRLALPPLSVDESSLSRVLDRLFPKVSDIDLQRTAVETAVRARTSVIAGGPGTGKTTVIARILAALHATTSLQVALAAPTGKAAARLGEVIMHSFEHLKNIVDLPTINEPTTVHRLLGSRGPRRGFTYDEHYRLSHTVVIVDEMSMVALPLMADLLQALHPDARLIMVGDPGQLASVEAGTVLADVVSARLPISCKDDTSSVVTLMRNHRNQGRVSELADAIRAGRGEDALALAKVGGDDLKFIATDSGDIDLNDVPHLAADIHAQAHALRTAALDGDAVTAVRLLERHRIICAHRSGPFGVSRWSHLVDFHLRSTVSGYGTEGEWFPGRSVLITRNSPAVGVNNGDTGVVVLTPHGPRVALSSPAGIRLIDPEVIYGLETLNVMTVHKSQGSQFEWVTVILPPVDSPLLTRELLYTAITRAQNGVRVVESPEAFLQAAATPARRASGLATRLRYQYLPGSEAPPDATLR